MRNQQWAAIAVSLALAVPAAAEVSGKWRFSVAGGFVTEIADVVESSGGVSVTVFGGTLSGPSLASLTAPSGLGFACPLATTGFVTADERHMRSSLAVSLAMSCGPPIGVGDFDADRCSCFDGNTDDGDGCSAKCQVEPCFTCSGAPSVCAPSGDSAACDDGRDCTAGSTCSAGICGGGTAVAGCHDLSGSWLLHVSSALFGNYDSAATFSQRDGFVEYGSAAGEIDPATGAFFIQFRPTDASELHCPRDGITGGLAADGRTFSASMADVVGPLCSGATFDIDATRCGGGTLDAGEACDDGNGSDGDGCSAACTVEPCWQCDSAAPSTCAALDGVSCDPGDACVTGATCSAGVCSGGTGCAPCLACDTVAGCVASPRVDCGGGAGSSLLTRSSAAPGGDLFTWRARAGTTTPLAALGNPTAGTDYDLCVYDRSGTAPALLYHHALPAGAAWRPTARGFVYRDAATRAALKSGAAGRASALLKLRTDLPPSPFALPLTVQLQGRGAACFAADYDTDDVRTNTTDRLKAR